MSSLRPTSRSRSGTPGRRSPTPDRVVSNQAEAFMKNPPNNLDLPDPRTQDRASDLIGVEGTEPVRRGPMTEAEKERVRKVQAELKVLEKEGKKGK